MRNKLRAKKYVGVFRCLETDEETTQEFEDWIGGDGKLVCSINQLVDDWAYGFYDKGPYKEVSFEEIVPPVVDLSAWRLFWAKI